MTTQVLVPAHGGCTRSAAPRGLGGREYEGPTNTVRSGTLRKCAPKVHQSVPVSTYWNHRCVLQSKLVVKVWGGAEDGQI